MKYRQLGSSDLHVSEISLGSWLTFGVGVEADAGSLSSTVGLAWRALVLWMLLLAMLAVAGWS